MLMDMMPFHAVLSEKPGIWPAFLLVFKTKLILSCVFLYQKI